MGVSLINGEWVHEAGDPVLISALHPRYKRILWRGIQRIKPELGEYLENLQHDEQAQALAQHFGAGPALRHAEYQMCLAVGRIQLDVDRPPC